MAPGVVGVLARLDYSQIGVHDWYVYALARAIGLTWVIGEEPTLEYRQHDSNVQGANSGAGATRARMEKLRSGFYRRQFILVAQACLSVGSYDARERRALESLAAHSLADVVAPIAAKLDRSQERERIEALALALDEAREALA